MKKLFSLFVLLLSTIGIMAQTNGTWENNRDGEANSTFVIADLQVTNGDPVYVGNYTIAAFVGDDCRLVSADKGGILKENAATTSTTKYLLFRIPGNYSKNGNEDDGKAITFMIKNAKGEIYELTASETITYRGEDVRYGDASSPVHLSVKFPTSISIKSFDVKVGQTVNLRRMITIEPRDAAEPQNTWALEGIKTPESEDAATLSGDILTGVKPKIGATVKMISHTDDATVAPTVLAQTTFNVIQPATGISITTSTYEVELNAGEKLTQFMNNLDDNKAYSLTPADANVTPEWEIEKTEETYITKNADASGWTPVKKGTTRIRPYVTDETGAPIYPADDKWITVNIVVSVKEASLTWDVTPIDMKCNVGDDLYPRIKVTITPKEADQTFTISAAGDNAQYFTISENSVKVIKAPTTATQVTLTITPTGTNGGKHAFEVPVSIDNLASTLELVKDALSFTSATGAETIKEAIKNNVTYGPEGTGPDITFTAPGSAEGTAQWINLYFHTKNAAGRGDLVLEDKGSSLSMTPGDHTVTATLTYPNYNRYYGNANDIRSRTETVTFTVSISNALKNFVITVKPNDTDPTTGSITLTPEPSDASYDIKDYTFTIADFNNVYATAKWNFITTSPSLNEPQLSFNYSDALPGKYEFKAVKDGKDYGSAEFDIPAMVQMNSGWQWLGNSYGAITNAKDLENFFTTNLVEARTYTDLLYNDPSFGFVGTFTSLPSGQMYKANMKSATTSLLYDAKGFIPIGDETSWVLKPGWNWVASPYFYDRQFTKAFKSSTFEKGMVIVSKTDGFMEYDGTAWTGSLKVMKAGQGYIVFNPKTSNITLTNLAESGMAQSNETVSGARNRAAKMSVWQYDHSRFASNMAMVAEIPQLQDAEQYTIGAFVDGECRGEGFFENNHAFITVHCKNGELVSFRLHNELTDEYFDIDETVTATQRVGSLDNPFRMTSEPVSTGINAVVQKDQAAGHYDLSGRRVGSNTKGVSLQRMADGKVMKVVVK